MSKKTAARPTALVWHKALERDELPEGRVRPVTCAHQTACITHFEGSYHALDNACPHQGGPLGEGSIENGWLRCPWHGWDFHPATGRSPGGFEDMLATFTVEVPSPHPEEPTLSSLEGGGTWHRQEWIGAVLTGSRLIGGGADDRRRPTVHEPFSDPQFRRASLRVDDS